MTTRFQLLCTLLVLAVTAVPARAAAPAWVEALTKISIPAYGTRTSAVGLLDETRTVVADNGEIRVFHRVAYKILTRDGLGLAWLRLPFDSETKITNLKAWNVQTDGIVHEAAQKDALEGPLTGDGGILFDDNKSLLLLIPQADVGSILAYEYERRHRPHILQDLWILQNRYPVLRSRIDLQLPPNWEFQYRFAKHEDAAPRETARNAWAWELTNLPAIPAEEGMPSLLQVSAVLFVTYFPSGQARGARSVTMRNWDDLASWMSQLADSRDAPSAEITETAQKLGTPQALAAFVQQKIRYVAIEIGIGGYQPHQAQETFRNQYGDCKDKVTLYRSLMKALNREVFPVLINASRGGLLAEFPSPLYFNHMIAAIPIADNEGAGPAVIQHPDIGRVLLFDPTDEKTPFGQLPSALQGVPAVVVRGGRAVIIDTPISLVSTNRVLRVGDFKVTADGTLAGDVTESFWGALSVDETNWLLSQPRDEWVRGASRVLSRELPGTRVGNFAVSDLNQREFLQERYSIQAPRFTQTAGDLLLMRPAIFGGPGQLSSQEETRSYPYQFGHVRSERSSFSFQLPDGYIVDTAPERVELDLPFVYFRTEVSVEAKTLRYISVYEIRRLEAPASDFDRLRQFYEQAEAASRAVVILKRVQ